MHRHSLQLALLSRQRICHRLRQKNPSSIIHQVNTVRRAQIQTTPPIPGTYFQTPPLQSAQKPSLRWRFVRGSIYCLISAVLGVVYTVTSIRDDLVELTEDLKNDPHLARREEEHAKALQLYARQNSLINGLGDPFERNLFISTTSASPTATIHQCQAPSNMPCEDVASIEALALPDSAAPDVLLLSIFDGHAGLETANIVNFHLPQQVLLNLVAEHNFATRAGKAFDDTEIRESMEKAFAYVDQSLITTPAKLYSREEDGLRERTMAAIQADSGSCAVMVLYDAPASRLHIANLGDSRAVLGRWDNKLGRYKAMQLTNDHTGFNKNEVARLAKEHPGEKCIDDKTGRLFGLAVTRAFGDARWKWSDQAMEHSHRNYFTNSPRPNGVIKTPPYLSAAPEMTHTDVQTGQHPDFLITASDGLWDQLSSEAAVELVQLWLDKFVPSDHIVRMNSQSSESRVLESMNLQDYRTYTPGEQKLDLYYDEKEKAIKWKNDQSHWIVERSQCGEHLIQNALGGNRKELFDAVMSLPPSHSRNVRDDITVSVTFFNADVSRVPEQLRGQLIVT